MTINNPEVSAQAVHALKRLHQNLRRHFAQYDGEPSERSTAYDELANPAYTEYRDDLKIAYSQGHVLTMSAEDHVTAFLRISDTLKQAFAPWTCVRAVLETSAQACWLLDDQIGIVERAARSFATRYESMDQERKFTQGRGDDVSTIRSKMDALELRALDLGYTEVVDRNGRRIGVARTFPKITEQVRDTFADEDIGGEDAYRILSGMAHGRSWVMLQLGLRNIDESGGPVVQHIKQIPPVGLVYLCQLAASGLSKAVLNLCQIQGWSPGVVKTHIEAFDIQHVAGARR